MKCSLALLASVIANVALAASQVPLGLWEGPGLDVKEGARLDTLPTSHYTTFTNPLIPGKLRIKRHDGFCDPSVKSYSGYLDASYGTQHMFFYFFESRTSPADDPVIMWINGGPGCSSSTGLFMELGPCQVTLDGNSTVPNPYSWNNNANIFFLDQPVGVGFSHADFGIDAKRTEEAAVVIQQFVSLFFETFSEYKGRPFHMTGESYAGRYIPLFSAEIVDQNAKAVAKGLTPINLQSIAIGNGLSNMMQMWPTHYDIACTSASVEPFMSIAECTEMRRGLPLCLKTLSSDCEERHNDIACEAAISYCHQLLTERITASGINPYDVSKSCVGGGDIDCYPIQGAIETYLNNAEVRELLGVPGNFRKFENCDDSVNKAFALSGDVSTRSDYHISQLLERGIRVLLYDGVLDLLCNHVGYLKLANSLEWTGQAEFNAAPMKPWFVGNNSTETQAAGEVKSARGLLTFATVFGAGHLVPYDKPVESLAMIQRWLAGEDL